MAMPSPRGFGALPILAATEILATPDRYTIEQCAKQWRESDRLISADAAHIDRFHQITYEEFTADPATVLRGIAGFLGLTPFPDEVLQRSWHVGDKQESIQDMNYRSFERLSEKDLNGIEAVAGDVLTKYGYSRPVAASR